MRPPSSPRRRSLGRASRPGVEAMERRALMALTPLDPTFGAGGTATVAGLNQFTESAALVQPDGKVVVVGGSYDFDLGESIEVHRFDVDGTPDTTFGSDPRAPGEAGAVVGIVGVDGGGSVVPGNAVLQPDGKIVVAATYTETGPVSTGSTTMTTVLGTDVVRFNSDGTLDTTFGTGGTAIISTGGASLGKLALQADGKIVLAGSLTPAGASSATAAVARLDADGTLDATFGTGGIETLAPSPFGLPPNLVAVAIDPSSGKIVLAGTGVVVEVKPEDVAEAIRLNTDGTLDTTFGVGGYDLTGSVQTAAALAVQPDGKILIAGNATGLTSTTPALVRLNVDGSTDSTFDAAFTIPGGPLDYKDALDVSSLALQPDGKVLVGGTQPTGSSSSFAVARFDADGSKDAAFGTGGEATFRLPSNTADFSVRGPNQVVAGVASTGAELAVGSDGKIALVGVSTTVSTALDQQGSPIGSPQTIVARLLPVAVTKPTPGDYTGDGKADPAVYLPGPDLYAYRRSENLTDVVQEFGVAGDSIPVPGDYNGDGVTDVAVYIPSSAEFAIRPSGGGPDEIIPFGIAGAGNSIPAPGDYDGSGKTELAVYLPSLAEFIYRPAGGGGDIVIPFGAAGVGATIPAPGDYDGDGITDIAAYLPAYGAFAIRPSGGGPDEIVPFGIAGAGKTIPVPGDYTGSGYTEIAAYLPSLGLFAYRPSDVYNTPDVIEPFGIPGAGRTIPAPGDYDGDGKTDIAAYLPSAGVFAYRPTGGGGDVLEQFGIAGAGKTIPAASIPYANQGTLTAASASAGSTRDAAIVPLTEDLMAIPGAAKKKVNAG